MATSLPLIGREAHKAEVKKKRDPSADPGLLAELGHELRTPLNAIIGFADAMRGRAFGPLSEPYAQSADAIHEAGRHLLALVDDMTNIARIESGRWTRPMERFDVRDLISKTERLFALEARRVDVSLSANLTEHAVDVFADQRAIRQILINLIANALKFTPAGGAVGLGMEVDGADLLLIVKDTGKGLSTTAAHSQGEGLGLTLVRAFCKLHAGSMTMASEPGDGTVVTVRLPIITKP